MALKIKVETNFGEVRDVYVRLNNVDQLTNHDEAGPDRLRFRGYISKDAFDARKAFVWELLLDAPIDVSKPVWPQAYAALKAYDPTTAIEPPPPHPAELLEPLTDEASDELREQHAHAEAMHQRHVVEHEARLKEAKKLKAALGRATDA